VRFPNILRLSKAVESGGSELSFWDDRRGDEETSFGSQPFADNAAALLAIGWPPEMRGQ